MAVVFKDRLTDRNIPDSGVAIIGGDVYQDGAVVSKQKTQPTDENIDDVKDFLISIGKPGAYSSKDEDYAPAIGVYKNYHILIKHMPFNVFPKIKEPVKQTWRDENGDDVWLPKSTGVRREAVQIPTGEIDVITGYRLRINGYVPKTDLRRLAYRKDGVEYVIYDNKTGADSITMMDYVPNLRKTEIRFHSEEPVEDQSSIILLIYKNVEGVIPAEFHDAFDLEPSFVYYRKSPNDHDEMKQVVTDFVNAIKGRWLRIYEEYSGIGYDGVYLDSTDSDPKYIKRSYDHVEFSLHFRVNGNLTTVPFKTM